jgi:hypothetical protein
MPPGKVDVNGSLGKAPVAEQHLDAVEIGAGTMFVARLLRSVRAVARF